MPSNKWSELVSTLLDKGTPSDRMFNTKEQAQAFKERKRSIQDKANCILNKKQLTHCLLDAKDLFNTYSIDTFDIDVALLQPMEVMEFIPVNKFNRIENLQMPSFGMISIARPSEVVLKYYPRPLRAMNRKGNATYRKPKTVFHGAIMQLDLDGNLVNCWDRTVDACRGIGIKPSSSTTIRRAGHTGKPYKGFLWQFERDYIEGKKIKFLNTDPK